MSQQMQDAPIAHGNIRTLPRQGFWLDREGAIGAIAEVWDLDPADSDAWWLGAFGDGLAESVESLSRVVFCPGRGLVAGPDLDVRVFPVVPASPAHPVMVGVLDGDGPIICRGIEDVAETLPDALGRGPDHVVDGLEELLGIASALIPDHEREFLV